MEIRNRRKFFAELRNGPYTSVGSYPIFFGSRNGEIFSFRAARDNALELGRRFRTAPADAPSLVDANYESDLTCDLSGEPIERAYPALAEESDESDV